MPGVLAAAGASARLAFLLRAWSTPARRSLNAYAWPQAEVELAWLAASRVDEATGLLDATAAERRWLLSEVGAATPALIALGSALDRSSGRSPAGWRRLWRLWRRNRRVLMDPPSLLPAAEVAALAEVPMDQSLGRVLRELRRAQIRGEIRSRAGARRRVLDIVGRPR